MLNWIDYREAIIVQDVHLAHGTGTLIKKPRIDASFVENMPDHVAMWTVEINRIELDYFPTNQL